MAYDPANPAGVGNDPYAAQKNKAVQTAQAAGSNGMDAITRRYAAMGGLNSGSYAQATADNARKTQQDQEGAVGDINAQEVQNSLPFKQQEIQNQFQGGQADKQLGFQQSQLAQQESQFGRTLPLQSRQLDLEASQQHLDHEANMINQELGQYQNAHSGGLFGGGGFLGLGI